jgi:Tfp pilus assembly PilM family ATPase
LLLQHLVDLKGLENKMAQKLLSVTIGHDIIRICEVVRGQNKNLILLNAGEASTPRGSIDDGYIWNVPVVADAIQRLMKEKYLSGNKIIFSEVEIKAGDKLLSTAKGTFYKVGDIEHEH